ncbi:hypothetical protein CASFOL_003149 [Castilleja foliolosa]|uniref:Uncharacterized protein n=1 Tax=Castilleja foliolosa TaxID=1961234 RepID=A0ABD3EGC1_9LAMI
MAKLLQSVVLFFFLVALKSDSVVEGKVCQLHATQFAEVLLFTQQVLL